MKNIYKIFFHLISILMILTLTKVYGQQLYKTNQFNVNMLTYNPAYAGSNEDVDINLSVRQQWVGIDDAPRTQFVSASGFLYHNLGVGINLYNDITGPTRRTGLGATLAKHFQLTSDGKTWFSFGLTGELFEYYINPEKLETSSPDDPAISEDITHELTPDANFGFYVYSRKYFAGFSVLHLFESEMDIFNEAHTGNNNIVRTFLLMGGYNYSFNDYFSAEPSFLYKKNIGAPYELNAQVRGFYDDKYWLGVGYCTSNDINFMIGVKSYIYEIGYSYELPFGVTKGYTSGSHELYLRMFIYNPIRRKGFVDKMEQMKRDKERNKKNMFH